MVWSLDRLAFVVGLCRPADQITPGQPARGQHAASGFKGSETFTIERAFKAISN